uniref:collagen alpha-1(I) chain-like n=1 Tax=Callithrix jacchus TaxID=9483 RepID=UPI0023DD667A|nr:collagen alpha-1(I) chain-like [Callithrix jacchus]
MPPNSHQQIAAQLNTHAPALRQVLGPHRGGPVPALKGLADKLLCNANFQQRLQLSCQAVAACCCCGSGLSKAQELGWCHQAFQRLKPARVCVDTHWGSCLDAGLPGGVPPPVPVLPASSLPRFHGTKHCLDSENAFSPFPPNWVALGLWLFLAPLSSQSRTVRSSFKAWKQPLPTPKGSAAQQTRTWRPEGAHYQHGTKHGCPQRQQARTRGQDKREAIIGGGKQAERMAFPFASTVAVLAHAAQRPRASRLLGPGTKEPVGTSQTHHEPTEATEGVGLSHSGNSYPRALKLGASGDPGGDLRLHQTPGTGAGQGGSRPDSERQSLREGPGCGSARESGARPQGAGARPAAAPEPRAVPPCAVGTHLGRPRSHPRPGRLPLLPERPASLPAPLPSRSAGSAGLGATASPWQPGGGRGGVPRPEVAHAARTPAQDAAPGLPRTCQVPAVAAALGTRPCQLWARSWANRGHREPGLWTRVRESFAIRASRPSLRGSYVRGRLGSAARGAAPRAAGFARAGAGRVGRVSPDCARRTWGLPGLRGGMGPGLRGEQVPEARPAALPRPGPALSDFLAPGLPFCPLPSSLPCPALALPGSRRPLGVRTGSGLGPVGTSPAPTGETTLSGRPGLTPAPAPTEQPQGNTGGRGGQDQDREPAPSEPGPGPPSRKCCSDLERRSGDRLSKSEFPGDSPGPSAPSKARRDSC